jgi:hypothetical protein
MFWQTLGYVEREYYFPGEVEGKRDDGHRVCEVAQRLSRHEDVCHCVEQATGTAKQHADPVVETCDVGRGNVVRAHGGGEATAAKICRL